MRLSVSPSSLAGKIVIPASKSHTIRAVALAGIAHGTSVLGNPLYSDDALSCIEGIKAFGAKVTQDADLTITGTGGLPDSSCSKIDVGNSGTSLRILTGLASLADFPIIFDGDSSIRTRLMQPLIDALGQLGATFESTVGKCPLTVKGPIRGGKTKVNGVSSQFLTALLFACPLAKGDTEIVVESLNERPYVHITLNWLRKLNIRFEHRGLDWFGIPGNQSYQAFNTNIPADFSSATFAACAAAITGSEVTICGLDFNDHQGDKAIFSYLERMGVSVTHSADGVVVKGGGLHGADIDMNDTPDALPAMAVTACFAKGVTRLMNVPQARLKECDRIAASTNELRKMGANIEELPDGMVIHQSKLIGTKVHGYHDHRIVMALSIAGMAARGETSIDTPEAIGVTYPSFVRDMATLGAHIELLHI